MRSKSGVESCTSQPYAWLPPARDVGYFNMVTIAQGCNGICTTVVQVNPAAVAEIRFVLPGSINRKRSHDCDNPLTVNKIPRPTETELESFYSSINEAKKKPALLSITPPFAKEVIPRLSLSTYPKPLMEYYNLATLDMKYPDLLKKCETVYVSIEVGSVWTCTFTYNCIHFNVLDFKCTGIYGSIHCSEYYCRYVLNITNKTYS